MESRYLGLVLALLLNTAVLSHGGITSSYVRKPEASVDMPLDAFPSPPGYNAPEQFCFSLFNICKIPGSHNSGDHIGSSVIVSWVTPEKPGPKYLTYWEAHHSNHKHKAHAMITFYRYYNYTSGFIHHATIKNLQYDTHYFYEIGSGKSARQFSFTTPPKVGLDVPCTFGVIGWRWDSWARFVEKSIAYQPWIWTAGNHEIDFAPEIGESVPFKPYMYRYHVPYKASESTSPLWYSIKRASAHIIVLSSYSAYGTYTPQYNWLQQEFTKVNRSETPWLIVLLHSPWYNSDSYH
uniref:Purple acid phosphatase n=1 Tax=Nelumbo nucifera TaxID=4432 RepID=A0A822Z723_NELNU|nr:TPA_asm: hypothetical protein HUJ06_014696 [Nelumbo nucifera]